MEHFEASLRWLRSDRLTLEGGSPRARGFERHARLELERFLQQVGTRGKQTVPCTGEAASMAAWMASASGVTPSTAPKASSVTTKTGEPAFSHVRQRGFFGL